jgi:hypothetical protein
LVHIEEDGRDTAIGTTISIPKCKRVIGPEVRFDAYKRGANLKYVKITETGNREDVDEWIEWSGEKLSDAEFI